MDTVSVRVRVRVRISRLVVAISRTIPCNDHERRLSEWRPFRMAALRNGGPEPPKHLITATVSSLDTE